MKKKQKITMLLSLILTILLITIGLSYAYFSTNITGTETSTTIEASGGVMNINYDGGENIITPNIFPSNEAFATKNFTLTGKSTTNDNMNYHIILVVEENTFTNNALSYKLISDNIDANGTVAPSINDLTGISTDSNEIFLGNGTFESPTTGNKLHTYKLELYFPVTGEDQNENQGKIFNAYVDIRENKYVYNNSKEVNHPVLFTGMMPIKWDENNNEIETTESDPDWYDYDEKRWANAKSADDSYWVWIPRYAYKITSGYHKSETGTIDVKFLKGRTNEPIDSTPIETEGYEPGVKDTSIHHFLHPVFQFNEEELGFWVAKYEPSVADISHPCYINESELNCDNNNLVLKIVPNVKSWRYINVATAYEVSKNIKNKYNVYGWFSNEVESYMMTNLEWGAVSYLSHSAYGANDEIWNNSYSGYKTGCGGSSVNASNEDVCLEYNTENGMMTSTTYNIYGVYDMSGGSNEYVMANYNYLPLYANFSENELILMNNNHLNKYYTAHEDLLNEVGMDYDKQIYGDAVYETSYNAARHNGTGSVGASADLGVMIYLIYLE